MASNETTLTLSILDRDYRINCPAGAEAQLRAAASLLNERMLEIKQASTAQGTAPATDRIAVIAALNLAHSFLQLESSVKDELRSVTQMHQWLDDALAQE